MNMNQEGLLSLLFEIGTEDFLAAFAGRPIKNKADDSIRIPQDDDFNVLFA
jgi:hypothetical protein